MKKDYLVRETSSGVDDRARLSDEGNQFRVVDRFFQA